MTITRRDFLKQSAIVSSAAVTVGIPVNEIANAATLSAEAGWRWDKGVCRFCGVGCGIQIATEKGKIVATKADVDAPVNRGLNCIKGYFNGKIIYGQDRLTRPLLRNAPGKVTDHLINARYNCNQCHVPQTDAPPLVENTFSAKKAR